MKNIAIIAACSAAIAALCSGCIKDPDKTDYRPPKNGLQIKITSGIGGHTAGYPTTRAYDSTWEAKDEIGIYMIPAGGAFSDAHQTNVRYIHAGNGVFEPAPGEEGGRPLFYPSDGTAVDFTAYYPFRSDVHQTPNNHTYPVDVSNQTDQPAIDLMIAQRVEGKTSGDVTFDFSHRLAKIVFNVTDGDSTVNLDGMTTIVEGMKVTADCNLENGAITTTGANAAITALPSVTTAGDNKASASAIVLPGTSPVSFDVTFSVPGLFEASYSITGTFRKGNVYTYNFKLKGTELVPVAGCVISPWNDNEGGNEFPEIEIPKTSETGSGGDATGNALFQGADFEDWALARASLAEIHEEFIHSATGGNPGGVISITNKKWGIVPVTILKVAVPNGLSSAKSISFDIKGTAKDGGGFLVTFGDDDTSNAHPCFYMGDPTLTATINPSSSVDYSLGAVDTKGEWVRVTLNTRGLAIQGNEYLISFICRNGIHNLAFDNFYFEK